ncbi:MAG: TetR/AcrR family transcriptional regulator [Eubacteriaceae bacterium]|nr:TetR/AcrR family transcriptional regulator [Eubacteriaceae bacterium]
MASYKKSIETKEKIIQTASTLFFIQGYNATTIRDIANQSELSLSRLNYHFISKADVAGVICKKFLSDLNTKLWDIIPIKENKILRDTIHIRYWVKIFLSQSQAMNFYYELACENILGDMLIESDYQHFIEQAEFLNLNLDEKTLCMYAHIFVVSLIQLIRAKKEGAISSEIENILDMCNTLHLKLLGLDQREQEKIISKARIYTNYIQYEMTDLSSIQLKYSEQLV